MDPVASTSNPVETPFLMTLPEIPYPTGNLCFGESGDVLPFAIERVYYVYGIPESAVRGGHAHKQNREAFFCIQGGCTLWLYSRTGEERRYRLAHPAEGVFIPAGWWVELGEYMEGSLTLVAASMPYDENDYIRNPEEFFVAEPYPDTVHRPRC